MQHLEVRMVKILQCRGKVGYWSEKQDSPMKSCFPELKKKEMEDIEYDELSGSHSSGLRSQTPVLFVI